VLIAARAMDASAGWVYIRGEYRYLIEHMNAVIAKRTKPAGWARTFRARA
jgi:NADH:ubiquinone oxidoreductase subunit F (NADH-binding)